MTKAEQNAIIRRALSVYGADHQINKLFEELGELTTEVARGSERGRQPKRTGERDCRCVHHAHATADGSRCDR